MGLPSKTWHDWPLNPIQDFRQLSLSHTHRHTDTHTHTHGLRLLPEAGGQLLAFPSDAAVALSDEHNLLPGSTERTRAREREMMTMMSFTRATPRDRLCNIVPQRRPARSAGAPRPLAPHTRQKKPAKQHSKVEGGSVSAKPGGPLWALRARNSGRAKHTWQSFTLRVHVAQRARSREREPCA